MLSAACFFVETNNIFPPETIHLCISSNAAFIISRVCTKSIICIEFFEPKI